MSLGFVLEAVAVPDVPFSCMTHSASGALSAQDVGLRVSHVRRFYILVEDLRVKSFYYSPFFSLILSPISQLENQYRRKVAKDFGWQPSSCRAPT